MEIKDICSTDFCVCLTTLLAKYRDQLSIFTQTKHGAQEEEEYLHYSSNLMAIYLKASQTTILNLCLGQMLKRCVELVSQLHGVIAH